MSDGMVAMGREFIILVTSAMRVTNNSWVSCRLPRSRNIASNILLAVPICLSQAPPK